ncbi:Carotenoid cleavage dioxygenase 8 protein [Thalictrum thalictroides]|uniref:Carotenoid cleavage dioxygenase 8 protein n=1 Tax=Thalictrum thalictroides TaxID=46969 RepID=A0A7J6XE23_THATH|nr:Carotenoid cleavage dioxygenase 8 protein [Thalictrum thalictroides]
MATLMFSGAGSMMLGSNSTISGESRNVRDGFLLKKSVVCRSKSMREMTVTNVTTRPPMSMPVVTDESVAEQKERKLAAWTSVRQEKWEGELVVEGEIPLWLNGTYLRNGPGRWHIGDYTFRHLFDGYATLIKLEFDNGRSKGAHRQIESEAYKAAMKNNKLCYREFSEDPKPENFLSFVGKLASLFSGASLTDNANAGVMQLADGRVLCITETTKGSYEIDPTTLETIGKFEYTDTFGAILQAAHGIVTKTDYLTILPDVVTPGYQVVRMEAGTNERKLLGRVNCRGGPQVGWVHSFPVTENYVIVPEMPLRYSTQNLLNVEPTPLYKFAWLPESKGYMHVMCKSSGNIVASVEVPLFVTFHYLNAYEETDEDGRLTSIIVDCCEHEADTTILDVLRLQNLRSNGEINMLPFARIGRFTLPMDGSPMGTLEAAVDPTQHGRGMDTATINNEYIGKKHRYVYGCGAHRPTNFPNMLTKVDVVNKTTKTWHDEGAIPSEPFFVPRPGAVEEDDGVVISMISDRHGEGYALLLNGTTFEEIGRAKFPYGLPYGLHGCWIPKN